MQETLFIHAFQQTRPKCLVHLEPDIDDRTRQRITVSGRSIFSVVSVFHWKAPATPG